MSHASFQGNTSLFAMSLFIFNNTHKYLEMLRYEQSRKCILRKKFAIDYALHLDTSVRHIIKIKFNFKKCNLP